MRLFKLFNPEFDSDDWREWRGGLRHVNDSSDQRTPPERKTIYAEYSRSADAALSLVPEGWDLFSLSLRYVATTEIVADDTPYYRAQTINGFGLILEGDHREIPLAITAASLRVLAHNRGICDG